jgi:hypothetical protein
MKVNKYWYIRKEVMPYHTLWGGVLDFGVPKKQKMTFLKTQNEMLSEVIVDLNPNGYPRW